MNERIEELYNLAHEEKPIVTLDTKTFEPIVHDGTYRVLNPEKFAELIINKCGEIADEHSDHAILSNPINKYFGVE